MKPKEEKENKRVIIFLLILAGLALLVIAINFCASAWITNVLSP